jgi:hypothetical protein
MLWLVMMAFPYCRTFRDSTVMAVYDLADDALQNVGLGFHLGAGWV